MSSGAQTLLHICTRGEWDDARRAGERRPESLDAQGFVHLSSPEQVHLPANRLFLGRTDLVLLHLDPDALGAPVRWEPGVATDPESMRFPHLYGPIPVDAVIDITSYQPDVTGRFAPLSP
ncbi:DUF952 domain-containing protein [Aldersonia kunmingensis]|uniref:DUF952 domain-containing protein n=1 Tax=Aldersonia kunmingensis TaxID=408066 RepID=UPI000834E21B|nr:DUF952 domain-containing protein [Aldersonia kunmingensis]